MSRISLYERMKNEPVPELDVVVKKSTDKKELEYQTFFSDRVLSGETQHFPLVYKSDDDVFSMEKFDGDFFAIKDSLDLDEILSCYLQVMMALQFVDSHGKFHGDLNPGNVLFKKIDDGSEYITYVIDGKTYRVKHFNRLWVLADFELAGEKGIELSAHHSAYDDAFFKRMFCGKKLTKPVKGSWCYDMYVFARVTQAAGMASRVFDLIESDCPLRPIDAITIVVANDITNLFLRE